ncbi:MATE family efflux transporter [Gulosibacter bifidus]|uniref:MATE family efflux transporter n=1 Tax=Gulosibacter bifidus TaxID=272239 RepID=A0ABW5RJE8_9MICO|nr:MATE family efflux transporter [Gulosibacter bifidus]
MTTDQGVATRSTSRRILALAIPALGALVAQPIFVATDTAMVGHLGETVLAGLSIGSMCITTLVGLMIFLAYTTTPVVARRLGAGNRADAIRAGIDGMWLALYCAVALLLVGLVAAGPVISTMTDDPFVASAAMSYLTISLWGLPGMLVSIAATGLLRGLQDTRTPLVVSLCGAVANIGFNYVFIFGLQLGIAGSALGTAVVETLMACVYAAIALKAAGEEHVSLSPGIGNPTEQLRASTYMLLRTLTLRIALVATVWAAGQLGTTTLATFQIAFTIFNLLAFALDALAIAAQAMIGHDLGERDGVGAATDSTAAVDEAERRVRSLVMQLSVWGLGFGLALGALLLAVSPWLGSWFTNDPKVQALSGIVLFVVALPMPIAGLVFVLDGVLIGAADNAYLALSGVVNLAVFGGALALAMSMDMEQDSKAPLVWLAFGGAMMCSRAITLGVRALGSRWMQLAPVSAPVAIASARASVAQPPREAAQDSPAAPRRVDASR